MENGYETTNEMVNDEIDIVRFVVLHCFAFAVRLLNGNFTPTTIIDVVFGIVFVDVDVVVAVAVVVVVVGVPCKWNEV